PPALLSSARLRARGSPLRRRDYNGGTGPATVPIPRRARDHARRSSSVPSWAGVASRAQLCECAQEVSAEHLLDGRRREGAFEHDLHEPRQLEARAKVARWDDQAVPVTAERRSVLPCDLDNVREVHEDAPLVQAPQVVLPHGGEAAVLAQPGEG